MSARDDTHDVVAASEAGADDFVTEPFEVNEITARMRALLRRSRLSSAPEASSDLVLDSDPRAPLMHH